MQFFQALNRLMYQACGYIWYLMSARHRWGYGLHSPFMFWFHRHVLAPGYRKQLKAIRGRVRILRKDPRTIYCEDDPGAGSSLLKRKGEKLRSIVRRSSVCYKYGKVLFAAALEFQPSTILELGTSVGISTMYLCEGAPRARVYTIEACAEKLAVCHENARQLNHDNLNPLQGTFEMMLPGLLNQLPQLDMVFIDGDHRKEKILENFEKIIDHLHDESLVIIDDIHWSRQMTQAWQTLMRHPGVKVSVDLHRMGLLFFKRELYPQRFTLAY